MIDKMIELLTCRAKRENEQEWLYGLLVHRDSGYSYAFIEDTPDYITEDALDVKNCTEVALQTRSKNGILKVVSIIPETLCRFTGMYDINKKRIFEKDVILTQPFTDKPFSNEAKSKRLRGVVEHYYNIETNDIAWELRFLEKAGKFTNCNWNDFFECEVVGDLFVDTDKV